MLCPLALGAVNVRLGPIRLSLNANILLFAAGGEFICLVNFTGAFNQRSTTGDGCEQAAPSVRGDCQWP